MLAVLADSASLSRAHFADALRFAEEHSIPIQVLTTAELDDPEYVKNDATRCFHCKDELFSVMEKAHRGSKYQHLAYGMNVDDRGEYRPGPASSERTRRAGSLGRGRIDEAGNSHPGTAGGSAHLG